MIAFKLIINEEPDILASVKKGILSLSIDKLNNNEIKLRLGGYEINKKHNIDWAKAELKKGDIIKLEIMDIDSERDRIANPHVIRDNSDIEDVVLQSKIKSYYNLEKELKEKGLI